MFINSHFHIPHGLTDVIVTTRTVPFVDNTRSANVFVFQIEKTFNLSCLPKDDENVFETREFVQLGDKCFAKSFISTKVRELDKNLLALFKKETRN